MAPSRIGKDGTETSNSPSTARSQSSNSSIFTTTGSSGFSSTSHSSRLDSYLSGSSGSSPRSRPGSSRRHRRSSSSSCGSLRSRSCSSRGSKGSLGSSKKSILKKKLKKKTSTPASKRSRSSKSSKGSKGSKGSRASKKRTARHPVGEFKAVKSSKDKMEIRSFLHDYSSTTNYSNFDAFTMSVDGIPFVAVSLMSANPALLSKLGHPATPPTPMKRRISGVNSPRKRRLSAECDSIHSSKCVRFSDESGLVPSPGARSSRSLSADEHRELTEKISEALVNNDRKYHDLWHDRVEESDRK